MKDLPLLPPAPRINFFWFVLHVFAFLLALVLICWAVGRALEQGLNHLGVHGPWALPLFLILGVALGLGFFHVTRGSKLDPFKRMDDYTAALQHYNQEMRQFLATRLTEMTSNIYTQMRTVSNPDPTDKSNAAPEEIPTAEDITKS